MIGDPEAIPKGKRDIERELVDYVLEARYEQIPEEIIALGKILTLTVLGTTIAGADAEGCRALTGLIENWGGKRECTILTHGGKVPAPNAVFVNSYIARALDFCEGMVPGMHLGSSCIPVCLAAAEMANGCTGKEYLTSLIVGAEVASRINVCSTYDGFDPTGVCTIFGATAMAGRILGIDKATLLNALGIAFNRAGGSFQSNIDGALVVRAIQGFASRDALISIDLAKIGITGPRHFLKGLYGYFHLFAKDHYDADKLLGEWMKRFEMKRMNFKKHPSCWATASGTDAALEMLKETDLVAEDVREISVTMTPYAYKLVGHGFEVGDRPTVNAQFNVSYCIANALLRRASRIEHFDPVFVRDPQVLDLVGRIKVIVDPELEETGHNALVLRVKTKSGRDLEKVVALPRGGGLDNPLTMEEHLSRFHDCVGYSKGVLPPERTQAILSAVNELETLKDVRALISLLLP
ncbi:MAG: MmgE/PrpD family protein [Desulfobacteraceae bacterium]|nr:MAG: MmgE/PrpD family protein [Desulfobacteraceae bacterium]